MNKKAPAGFIVVLGDGTWAPLEGCAIYRLKDDKVLAFADSVDEALGDDMQNVEGCLTDVQIAEAFGTSAAAEYSLCR
mgnify:FL=1